MDGSISPTGSDLDYVYGEFIHSEPFNFVMDFDNATGLSPGVTATAYCYSESSGWVDWGNLFALTTNQSSQDPITIAAPIVAASGDGSTSGTGGLASCLAQDGLGLDPISWVPGLVNMGVCGLEWLFVPSSAATASVVNAFGISSNAPTVGADSASQWLGAGAELLADGPYNSMVDIQTAAETGGCSLPDGEGYALDGHHFSVCDALSAVTVHSSGPWGVIKGFVTAAFYVGIFLLFIAFLRKTLGGAA